MALRKKDSKAKHGGGPTSVEGRARSSQNSTVHGCTSKKLLMPGESEEEYRQCSEMWFSRFEARSASEVQLIQQLVDADWRARRSERTLEAFEFELHSEEQNPARWTDEQMRRLGLFKRYYTTDKNAFEKGLKLVDAMRRSEVMEYVTKENIIDLKMKHYDKPRDFHIELARVWGQVFEYRQLPKERTDGGCACPVCLTNWGVAVVDQQEEEKLKRNKALFEEFLRAREGKKDSADKGTDK